MGEPFENARALFRALFDNWLDGVLLIEPETGKILGANKTIGRLLGYQEQDLLHRHFSFLYPEDWASEKRPFFQDLEQSDATFHYQHFKRADGSLCSMDVVASLAPMSQDYQLIIMNLRDASQREKLERELRQSEKRYETLVTSTTDYVYSVKVQNRFPVKTRHNQSCISLTGYAPEEFDRDPYLWIRMVPDEERMKVRRQAESILTGGGAYPVEHRIVRKDGSVRWVRNTPVPHYDEEGRLLSYDGLVQDITDYIHTHEQQRRLVAVIDQVDQGVVVTDNRGVIQYVNPAMEKLSGYNRAEVVGKNAKIFSRDRESDLFYRQIWMTISAGMTWSGQFGCNRKDGTPYRVQCTISPVRNDSGKITNYVSLRRDITQELRMQEQVQQAQKMEAIGTMAGGIAHDFNNILAAILGYSEMLEEEVPEGQKARKHVDQVVKAANRAKDLVRQILTFCRKSETELQPMLLQPIVKEVLKLIRASMPSTIELRQNIQETTGKVLADSTQIHQVVMNLCTNASQAMEEKGGMLEVSLLTEMLEDDLDLETGKLEKGPYARLIVKDTGCGMDAETREKIFLPFFSTKPQGQGTGMGLSLVHGIITGLGGTVQVDSIEGRGTTFDILIPVLEGETTQEMKVLPPVEKGRGERVLFVDDEDMLGRLWYQRLTGWNYLVEVCPNGQDALKLFEQNPSRFDIVITDQTMPRMTGLELAEAILEKRPQMPIILCTGYSNLVTPERVRDIGIRELLFKPVLSRELSLVLRRLLEERKARP